MRKFLLIAQIMPDVVQSNKASHNPETARKLWDVSEELTGLYYLDAKEEP